MIQFDWTEKYELMSKYLLFLGLINGLYLSE